MRQGQNNKRARGRNRKSHNSANRSFESNGPDVKIRGNAAHIAEKYVVLARDSQSSGDPISAENYLQHAEHYFRIVSAASGQQASAQDGGADNRNADNHANGEASDKNGAGDEVTAQEKGRDANGSGASRRRGRNQKAARGKADDDGEKPVLADDPQPVSLDDASPDKDETGDAASEDDASGTLSAQAS